MTNKPATVKEIIDILSKLNPNSPCYFRPKYYGQVQQWEDVPVNLNGISPMEPKGEPENVTFLC